VGEEYGEIQELQARVSDLEAIKEELYSRVRDLEAAATRQTERQVAAFGDAVEKLIRPLFDDQQERIGPFEQVLGTALLRLDALEFQRPTS
jgi:hypothetical protein